MDRYGHRKEIGREDERQRWVVEKMVMVKNEKGQHTSCTYANII